METVYQDLQKSNDDSRIEIKVCDPVIKDSNQIKGYYVYSIRGLDKSGNFDIQRRFNDFKVLRDYMVKSWPACFVPALPPKKFIGNLDKKFVVERMNYLNEFCTKMAQQPHLFYSQEFQLFLRNHGDLEKQITGLGKQSAEDLIFKYQNSFNHLSGKEINTEIVLKIKSFTAFLAKNMKMMENMKVMASNSSKARAQQNETQETVFSHLFSEYEKNVLSEYQSFQNDKFLFHNNDDEALREMQATRKQSYESNAYEDLHEYIDDQIKDIKAFQDALNMKQSYENSKCKLDAKLKEKELDKQKLLAGKTSLMGMFKTASKEQQVSDIEKSIQNIQKEQESINFICDILTVILGYIEIDNFKKEKHIEYFELMKNMANLENDYNQKNVQIWQYVQQHHLVQESQ